MSDIHNRSKARSKTHLKFKTPFKWVFMGIISDTYSKILTKYTTSANYVLIVDACSKILKLYGTENITTEEVMDKLDMFRAIFLKADEFGWWYMERIQTDADKKVYLQGVSGRSFCKWSITYISGTITSGN